ncbi:DUF2157 domain-containing protein [Moraxella pluranimalium]|uniref:DUF4401 domain-containing protein n=1 Tax=Moraxella pluranimalium TaxID=470453 RepID=A0A1T0CIB4_9GAMM|nr:DUF2157 domain-containing protein [Moraxella pluranimalium]OOS22087.1 hypothetical protein B0680_09615 [Moraxella pluranimalium]
MARIKTTPAKTPSTTIAHALISPQMTAHFGLFGLALVAVSLLYLVGANWLLLSDMVKIAIPMAVLMLSAVASLRTAGVWMSALHTVCALMAGLLLAVIGQVYQTGADSLWLFVLWSLLIVPWLYRVNDGAMVLLMVVSQIALWLTVDQMAWNEYWYPAWAMVLLLGGWRVFGRCRLSWLVALGLSMIAVYTASVDWSRLSAAQLFCTLMVVVSPWLFALWARVRLSASEQTASIAIGVVGGALAVFGAVVMGLEIHSLLVITILAHVWFGALAFGIYQHFGQNLAKVQTALLAVGGWLSSLFALIWLVVDVLMGVSSVWVNAVYALVVLMLGFGGLIKWQYSAYARHLGYALVIVGMGLVAYTLLDQLKQNSLWALMAVQACVLVLLWRCRVHWLYLLVHTMALYLSMVVQSFGSFDRLADYEHLSPSGVGLYALGLLPVFLLSKQAWLVRAHLSWRWAACLVLSVVAGFGAYFGVAGHQLDNQVMAALPLLILFGVLLARLPMSVMLWLLPLGVVAGFGYGHLLAVLMVLGVAVMRRDYLVYALALMVGIGLLWLFYYQLSLPFLVKFATIFVSGVVVLTMGVLLDRQVSAESIKGVSV